MLIILTCIPVLAPLFKFFSHKLGSKDYRTNAYGNNNRTAKDGSNGHSLQTLSKNGATTHRVSKSMMSQDAFPKNESQETILSTGQDAEDGTRRGQILKTVEVQIQSTNRNQQDDDQERYKKNFV
ncbi:hypothetical protein DH86_00000221 [Scytalidium sp. 3C]|nr:hypothetical protein DH86_00000221 [Scytalidium sp. 3C]